MSDLCDEYHIQPSLFYLLQRQALEHLSAALQDGRSVRGRTQVASADRARLAALEAKLARKDAIIAEVSEEYLAMKKNLGSVSVMEHAEVATRLFERQWTGCRFDCPGNPRPSTPDP